MSAVKPTVSTLVPSGSPSQFEPKTAADLEVGATALERVLLPQLRRLPFLQAGSTTDGFQEVVDARVEFSLDGEGKTHHRFMLDGREVTASELAAATSADELGKWMWWTGYQLTATEFVNNDASSTR